MVIPREDGLECQVGISTSHHLPKEGISYIPQLTKVFISFLKLLHRQTILRVFVVQCRLIYIRVVFWVTPSIEVPAKPIDEALGHSVIENSGLGKTHINGLLPVVRIPV
jgi:hypothetical protein